MTSPSQPPYVPGSNQPRFRDEQPRYWPPAVEREYAHQHHTPVAAEPPVEPPAPKRRRSRAATALLAAAAALAIMAIGFAGVYIAGPPIWYRVGPDTGVQACKAIAESAAAQKSGKTGPGPLVGDDDGVFTAAEYKELRSVFEHSRDEELRRHGTAFVDAVWQVANIKKGEEMGALAYLGTLTSSYSGLTGACAKHGQTLPPLGS